ncbi:hypothetical protein A2U01_0090845, partial [Trifolium medium]|nr:hypothetical protein [Trifolium medium]
EVELKAKAQEEAEALNSVL